LSPVTATRGHPARVPEGRLPVTAEGTSAAQFGPIEWALVMTTAAVWGASFLLMAEGLEAFEPGLVTLGRLVLGCAVLVVLPRTRATRVARGDWPRVALLGLVWFAVPLTLFPIAEQSVSSAVTGMLNGALPLFAAAVSAALLRRPPGRRQLQGLAVGFAGVLCVSVPSLSEGSSSAWATVLVLAALVSYALAGSVVVPLQQRYGALAVIARAELVAIVLTTPFAAAGVSGSRWSWSSAAAVGVLGVFGTGLAFVAAGTVYGRVGPTRGAVIAYLIPVVALLLGVLLRDEHVEAVAIAGLGVVLVGAWLTSRSGR
jgi:drug/metabolite transporter (DMT)-like permease